MRKPSSERLEFFFSFSVTPLPTDPQETHAWYMAVHATVPMRMPKISTKPR